MKNKIPAGGIVKIALDGIVSIKPLLHRIVVSQQDYNLDIIKTKLRVPNPRKANEEDNKKYPKYRRATNNNNLLGGRVSLYFDRMSAGPSLVANVIGQSEDGATPFALLRRLSKALPEGKVSSVEYAIDIYCEDHVAVANLYYLLRRYMFFRNRDSTSMKGGGFIGWEGGCQVERRENSVYTVWNKARDNIIKIYERGAESKRRESGGWKHVDVDRVRLEFVIPRSSKILSENNIGDLSSFYKKPRFSSVLRQRVSFKIFTHSNLLPGEDDNYEHVASNDPEAHAVEESFQEEYLYHRDKVKNISQYLGMAKKLDYLKKLIFIELEKFDQSWKENLRNKHKV